MLNFIQMKWSVFKYNFSWPDYVTLFEGPVARGTIAIPFFGYLILFNDTVVEHITFKYLTSDASIQFGLSMGARLKFIYLGLTSISIASIIYYLRRPYAMRIGRDQFEYVERTLTHFTVSNYIQIHGEIRNSDFDPYTQHGKYYNSEFDDFLIAAAGDNNRAGYNWVEAKNKFESLLRSMLIEFYFRQKISRRSWLITALLFACIGYALLLIPSLELFSKVMWVIVKNGLPAVSSG